LVTVRLATLQDTAAICAIHCSDVPQWTRLTADGQLVATDYDSLSLYERWQHGGAWLSLETCAVHLNRLLAGSGFPLVACVDGQVVAEAEVYESFEPPPFGHNLEISVINTHAAHQRRGYGKALIAYILPLARLLQVEDPSPPARSPLDYVMDDREIANNLFELTVGAGSPWVGQRIFDLMLPDDVLIVLIGRGSHMIIPRGTTFFEAGDKVLVLASDSTLKALRAEISPEFKPDSHRALT